MRTVILALSLLLSPWISAQAQSLELISSGGTEVISIDDLRAEAQDTADIYGPYRKSNLTVRGYPFAAFLKVHFGSVPDKIKITAVDGYQIELSDIDDRDWFLVTHENGKVIDLRNHGPLRLVETDLGDRDPNILALYDDWIWMIKTIEASE